MLCRYLIGNGGEESLEAGGRLEIQGEMHNGVTPLHLAAAYGNGDIVSLLLENDDDQIPSAKMTEPVRNTDSGKSPLHLAKTPEIAHLLLEGRDSTIDVGENEMEHITNAFHYLVKHNSKVAEIFLDDCISTNDKTMDSKDLLIIYNLKYFRGEKHEMFSQSLMLKYGQDLLFHPLCKAMTEFKWRCISRAYYAYVMMKLLFVLTLTSLVTIQTWTLSQNCTQTTENLTEFTNFEQTLNKTQSFIECWLLNEALPIVFIAVTVNLAILFVMEVGNVVMNRMNYIQEGKNWMDIIMLLSTLIYLVNGFDFTLNKPVTAIDTTASGAVSVFFVWINLVLVFRHYPLVGDYIHMFQNVSKTLFFFLVVYFPALFAFALAFMVLTPSTSAAFKNTWKASMKILSMLIGELDYEDNFIDPKGLTTPLSVLLVQVLSIAFICFGSIVVMNLLVGLTVNEIEKMKLEASNVRLKETVTEMNNLEELLLHVPKPDFLSNYNATQYGCFSNTLRKFHVLQRLKMSYERHYDSTTFAHLKLCIQPSEIEMNKYNKDKYWIVNFLKRICLFWMKPWIGSKFRVYFYDDQGTLKGEPTEFTVSKTLVEATMERIKKRIFHDENIGSQVTSNNIKDVFFKAQI